MSKRRAKGEGSIVQRHDHPTCPPLIDGHRAAHRCQGRWAATLDVGRGGKRQRRTLYARTQREAQRKLMAALRERDAGTIVTSSWTVERWLRYWLDVICIERGLKVNTLKSHRSKVEQYLIPHLGRHRVDHLQPEHVREMYAAMRKRGLADATLRQTHAILRRALAVAVREGKASRNVASDLDPPQVVKVKRTPLSVENARRAAQAGGLRWYLALYLGMRQGEVLALRWVNVNLEEGWLFIEQSMSRAPGVGLVFDTPKTAGSVRQIPLPAVVLSRFKVAWAEHLASGGPTDGLVFHHGGQPIDPRRDWQEWSDLLDSLDIPHVPLHAARNTAASLLEAHGVPSRLVGEILGQSTVAVTHQYQLADLQRRREALELLSGVFTEG